MICLNIDSSKASFFQFPGVAMGKYYIIWKKIRVLRVIIWKINNDTTVCVQCFIFGYIQVVALTVLRFYLNVSLVGSLNL